MGNFRNLRSPIAQYEWAPTLEFGAWLPDQQDLNSPGVVEALNVIPLLVGYGPCRDHAPITGFNLPASCHGGVVTKDRWGNARIYAATQNSLYTYSGSGFLARYTTGGLEEGIVWQFVKFGEVIVAIHPGIVPVYSATDSTDMFAVLGGSPPKARVGARVGDFLVLGNLSGETDPDGSVFPSRIRWSGFNNIDTWGTDPNTQADFNDMSAEGGAVMAIAGREDGTIFQETTISRMTYVGPPTVFDIKVVEEERGAICSAIVDDGPNIYFISHDGFYVWNGVNSVPISDGQITKWFFSKLNYQERKRIVGALDAENNCVRWAFPVDTGVDLVQQVVYNYHSKRWSHTAVSVEHLLTAPLLTTNINDALLDLTGNYLVPLSSESFATGRTRLAAFNGAHTFGLFVGPIMAAQIETGDYTGPQGLRIMVNNARPIVDVTGSFATLRIASRDQLQVDSIVYSGAHAQEATGLCSVLGEGRYLRFVMEIPAGKIWSHIQGIEVSRKVLGSR